MFLPPIFIFNCGCLADNNNYSKFKTSKADWQEAYNLKMVAKSPKPHCGSRVRCIQNGLHLFLFVLQH